MTRSPRTAGFRPLVRRLATVLSLAAIVVALPGSFAQEEPPVPTPEPTPEPTHEPTPEPTPEPPAFSDVSVRLTPVAPLAQSVALAVRNGDPALYVATKDGRVHAVRGSGIEVVLDIRDELFTEGEAGLHGLTFTPDGKRMIVDFVDKERNSRIRSYPFDGSVDPKAGMDMLRIEHPDLNYHYAGTLAFGPDGFLYISHGDGGIPRDSKNRAQSLDVLLGKILRVEVRTNGEYRVPKDNPFVGREGARPEIWAYGLRNPWRFSFDAKTGDMWIADVGMTQREEINFERADSKGGRNYGWNRFEGTVPMHGPVPEGHIRPFHQYNRETPNCAVIGGFVYRGSKLPGLRGAYLFGDLCGGWIRAIRGRPGHLRHRVLDGKVDQLTSFGQDEAGELYVMSLNDGVFRLDPA